MYPVLLEVSQTTLTAILQWENLLGPDSREIRGFSMTRQENKDFAHLIVKGKISLCVLYSLIVFCIFYIRV